jgi:glycosyltransferase involved in cell wall biosynthesis
MPSRYENYSNALLEGLSCGIPFVGSDVGGNRMLAATGAGWVFAPDSARDLAMTLSEVVSDGDECRRRGACGRRYVSGRYSWEQTARRLEQIIRASQKEVVDVTDATAGLACVRS